MLRFIIAKMMIYQMPSLSYHPPLISPYFPNDPMIFIFYNTNNNTTTTAATTTIEQNGWKIKHTDKTAQWNFAGELSVCVWGVHKIWLEIYKFFRLLFILYIESKSKKERVRVCEWMNRRNRECITKVHGIKCRQFALNTTLTLTRKDKNTNNNDTTETYYFWSCK